MLNAQEYWNKRYLQGKWKSGYGSYGEQLEKKLNWLKDLKIATISEIGCGDFNFGKHLLELYPEAVYFGQDISDIIVWMNQQGNTPKTEFTTHLSLLPPADLLLCVDVLFHVLDDTEYNKLLETIKKKWTKYLAVTMYEQEQPSSPHLKIRAFDYKQFGEPLIREIVEEDGQLYFYLWKR